jgi:hypothetical protein
VTARLAVSIDPGATVGVAFWRWDDAAEVWVLESTTSWTFDAYIDWLNEGSLERYSLVALERFLLGGGQEALAQSGSDMAAPRAIGATEAAATKAGVEVIHTDRTKKKSAYRRIERRHGRVPGANVHSRDAVTVLVSATGESVDKFRFAA